MMFLSRTTPRAARVVGLHLRRRPRSADDVRVAVEHGGDVDAVLREDRRARDRLAEAAGADERDVVLALRAEDLADLAEQAVDVVADARLPNLPNAERSRRICVALMFV